MTSADPILALRARVAALGQAERDALRLQLEARGIAWERVVPEETARVRPERLPLTPGQMHFWIQQRLYPESSAYHVAYRWRFTGRIDRSALEKSLCTIVARHEPLRTAFPVEAGEPWQCVLPEAEFSLGYGDAAGSNDVLETIARTVATTPFDLTTAPLLRAHLIRVADDDHLLAITLHHIVADGWSRGVLMRELTACYRAYSTGEIPELEVLDRSYGDLVLDQQDWLKSARCERERNYWRSRLADLKELELPTDRSRRSTVDMACSTVTRVIPAELSAGVGMLASRLGTTSFVLLAAAFKLLLHRYAGQRDLSICVPVAARPDAHAAKLVGLFTNTIVLRAEVDPRLTFAQWVAHVQERFSDALEHQDFPFPMLADALGMNRDARQNPFSQVMFQLQSGGYRQQNAEQVDFGVEGLAVRQEPARLGETKVDLSWYVMERESGFLLNIEYRTALFDPWRIERMAAHFETLIRSILREPDDLLPSLSYMEQEERQAVIDLGTPVAKALPETTVHETVADVARRYPEAEALASNGRTWTYRELDRDVDALARALVARPYGVRPGDRVAVSLPGRGQSIIAFLAILKAGAVYVPLDPDHPSERVAYVLEDSGVELVLTDQPHLYPNHRHLDPTAFEPGAETAVLPSSDPSRIAYLLYTSGSTGRPNGVPICHPSLINHLRSMASSPGLARGDRMLAITTPTFDISILEMLLPLVVGATTVLYGQELLLAPQRLAGVLQEDRISHMQATPAYWRMLIDSGWEGAPTLTALCGGEALDAPLARRLVARTKVLWNVYGPTEATIWASALRVTPAHAESGKVPVGGLLDNTHLHVLDAYMEPLPRGIPGELYIGGVCLSPGYWNRPALAASRFVPNPFHDEKSPTLRLYRTGDAVVRSADGEIEFIGRTDFQVKLRGYRIEIGEIEDKLLRDSIVDNAIVTLDEVNERLIAYVLVKDVGADEGETERRLRQVLVAQLPRYMVPTAFVLMREFPLNPNGKVDRKALPVPQVASANATVVPPRNAAETTLLAIWKAVLRRDDIGVEDNFFDLGGDSIIGVQIVARAGREGLKLEPTQIFELQTVAAQAAVAVRGGNESETASQSTDIPPAMALDSLQMAGRPAVVDAFEMTPMQGGMLFHGLMAPESGTYFEQCWCVLEGPLDEAGFTAAWRTVIARHAVLRSASRWIGLERPVLVIHEDAEPEWQRADWTHLDRDGQADAFKAWLAADRRRGFRLDQAPLMRFALIRLGKNGYRFVWSFHHLVMDGWCGSLIVGEMLRAYGGLDLPPPPEPYRRYVEWRARQDGAAAEAYWRETLAGFPEPTLLAEKDGQEATGHFLDIREHLDPETAERLKAMARRERLTLATVLQGAWALLLSRYAGKDDVIFGTVLSGRPPELPGSDRMIGLFLNTVPLRARLNPATRASDWLRDLQAEHRHREKHGHAALADIQRWTGGQSLFDTLLIVENLPLSMKEAFANEGGARSLGDAGSYERTNYPLSLRVFPGDDFAFALGLDPLRISVDDGRRLLKRYGMLLAALSDNPHARLGEIEMLEPQEQSRLLAMGRGPETAAGAPIHDQVLARASGTPDKTAVVFHGVEGATDLSYRALALRIDALAARLQARGIGRGSVVAVYLDRGPELLPALLSVLRTGAAYLPIDPDYPAERIAYMLEDSGTALILTDRARSMLPNGVPVIVLGDDAGEVGPFSPVAVIGDDLAYILYTSGSTGLPKGVAISHGALSNFIAAMVVEPGIRSDDRLLALTTIGFDIAGLELYAPLAAGATVILAEGTVSRDGRRLAALVEQVAPTVMQATPAGWRMLVEAGWPGDGTLRMFCGGEALDSRLADELLQRGGELWNLYGPTETTIWSAAMRVRPGMLAGAGVPVAGAIDRTTLHVLDPRGLPVPVGVAGELHIGGAGLSTGYWGKPGLTAEKFIPNPFRRGPEDGLHLYRTGDLVRWREDGALDFLGRIDNQIKLRGYRIELGEIEARLAAYPLVAEAAVLLEDRGAGQQLAAYLRWRDPVAGDPARLLLGHMAETLPSYMVPSVYVPLEAFPLTPNGKVDRRALPALRPKPATLAVQPVDGEPASTLAEIWREALKVNSIGLTDNFFALGGHSLLVVSLQGIMRERFGVPLDITAFFRFPTLETMAGHIAALKSGAAKDGQEGRAGSKLSGRDRLAGRRNLRSQRTVA